MKIKREEGGMWSANVGNEHLGKVANVMCVYMIDTDYCLRVW